MLSTCQLPVYLSLSDTEKEGGIKKIGPEGAGGGGQEKKSVFKKYTPPPHML